MGIYNTRMHTRDMRVSGVTLLSGELCSRREWPLCFVFFCVCVCCPVMVNGYVQTDRYNAESNYRYARWKNSSYSGRGVSTTTKRKACHQTIVRRLKMYQITWGGIIMYRLSAYSWCKNICSLALIDTYTKLHNSQAMTAEKIGVSTALHATRERSLKKKQ